MAVRIRADRSVVCAAMHPAEPGDTYIDDGLHYHLAVELRVLVTEPMELPSSGLGGHGAHGSWWWRGHQPPAARIDPFYLEASAQ